MKFYMIFGINLFFAFLIGILTNVTNYLIFIMSFLIWWELRAINNNLASIDSMQKRLSLLYPLDWNMRFDRKRFYGI